MSPWVTKPHADRDEILEEVKTGVRACNQYGLKDQNWGSAADYVQSNLTFLFHCFKVYGSTHLSRSSDNFFYEICEVAAGLAYCLTKARSEIGWFESTLKYATYSIEIIPISNWSKFQILLHRAQAFTALGQDTKALRHLLVALQLIPQEKLLQTSLVS